MLVAGGVIFSVLPPLPGPVLSYGAIITVHYLSGKTAFDISSFIIWGVLTVLVMVADYLLPAAATRKFGGTKAGIIGGMAGMVAGFFLPIPFGIMIGALFGAVIGDLYGGNHLRAAFRSGVGSFLGFIVASSLKVLLSVIIGGVALWKAGSFTFQALKSLF